MLDRIPRPLGLFALSLALPSLAAAQCPEWSTAFSSPGAPGSVLAQTVTAGGDELVAGGEFRWIGATPAPYVAVFDGSTWTGLGSGPPGPALALASMDTGGTTTIFAGGDDYVAAWDGMNWTTFSVDGDIRALHVHDDGTGPALYAGGTFQSIDGSSIKNLARLNGVWSAVGSGLNSGTVRALTTHDDGSGADLYVGGSFDSIGGVQTRALARWDGASFHAVGGGFDGSSGLGTQVRAMVSQVGPGGAAELHVGGKFFFAGGNSVDPWVIWRQGAWIDAGSGPGQVYAMTLRDGPGGPSVCASRADRVDCFDGFSFQSIPHETFVPSLSLAAFGGGLPQDLYRGTGLINESGSHMGRWDGSSWRPLFEGSATGLGVGSAVGDLGVHDFGSGEELVAVIADFQPSTEWRIQRFNGSQWSDVPTAGLDVNFQRDIQSIDGSLYLIGSHRVATSNANWPAVRYDGNQWLKVGSQIPSSGWATTLTAFDAGSGPELYIGGPFSSLDSPETTGIARLEGQEWVSVAGGMNGVGGSLSNAVYKLLPWNDGTGTDLYAGGVFLNAGNQLSRSIARWDGTSWSPLAGGVNSTQTQLAYIYDMAVFDGPQGEQLIVAGQFDQAGNVPCSSIAAWDGNSWSALGSGIDGFVFKLLAFDPDGQGEQLYAMGSFSSAGGQMVDGSAVWDGSTWSPSGIPSTSQPRIEAFDDGTGRALFVGGTFDEAGGVPSKNIARFSDPCGATLGSPGCTSLPNSTGQAGLVRATGVASVAAMDITLIASRLPANANTLFFYGTEPGFGTAGDGVLCIGGLVQRILPVVGADANGIATQPFDFQAPYASNAIAGESIVVQGFYRDAAGGPAGFQTTDSLRIELRP